MPPRLFVTARLFAAIQIAVCSMAQDFQSILWGQTLQAPILLGQCQLQYHQRHYKAEKYTQVEIHTAKCWYLANMEL